MGSGSWRTLATSLVLILAATACAATDTVIADAPIAGQDAAAADTDQTTPNAAPSAATTSDPTTPGLGPSERALPEPPDAIDGPDLEARGMAVVEDAPEVLPATYSNIAATEDTGFYYTALDGQMSLVAFDTKSLTPRYQVAASPLGRVRGAGQHILIDRQLELVFVTGYDDQIGGEEGGYLAAHDATTGEELWRTAIDFWAAQPFVCGDKICVRSSGEQRSIDKATGSLMQFIRVSDRRLLLTRRPLTLTTVSSLRTGEFAALTGSSDFGFNTDWEITAAQFSSAAGQDVDPSFGWSAQLYPDRSVVIVYLARADGQGWATVAINSRTGAIEWGRLDLAPCVDSPLKLVPAIICITGDEPFVSTAVTRIDPRSGEHIWTHELSEGGSELVYDGTKLVAWWYDETNGGKVELDPATGEELPATRAALCLFLNPWHDFEYPDGDVLEFAGGTVYSMCSSDGYLLYPDEVIAMAPSVDIDTAEPSWLVDFDGVPITLLHEGN